MSTDCQHPVNFGGLCGVCGQDLTRYDPVGTRKDARVNIMISHENTMLYVSPEEAARLDDETASRLLKERKLSLILDLDQTVIHATVNPQLDSLLEQPKWSVNPVTRDVHRFMLPDNQGFYHVKLRPGLLDFLKELTKLFELHIYTMGTRHYAKAVAKVIDPKGEIFKERILSRDESGSFTKKTIQRLFPCDDSMVIVVDDRADVWEWSDNLIKVRPYVFFHNTGDINAPLTDKKAAKNISANAVIKSVVPDKEVETIKPSKLVDEWENDEMKSELPPPVPEESENNNNFPSDTAKVVITDKEIEEEIESLIGISDNELPFNLHEVDTELPVLTGVLKQVHSQFYRRFEQLNLPISLQERKTHDIDAKHILGRIKGRVFHGCHFVFSGVIPISQKPEKSEIWKFATSFGAQCSLEVTENTTHLVASRWGTDKVRQAAKLQNSLGRKVWIVKPAWLYDSVHTWSRKTETQYLLQDLEKSPIVAELESSLEQSRGTDLERPSSSLSLAIEHDSFLNEDDVLDISKEIADELGSEMSDDQEDDFGANDDSVDYDIEDESFDSESKIMSKMSFSAHPLHQSAKPKEPTHDSDSEVVQLVSNQAKRKQNKSQTKPRKKQKESTIGQGRSTKPRRPSPLGKTPVGGETSESVVPAVKDNGKANSATASSNKRKRKQENAVAKNDETEESEFDVDAFVADLDF